MNWLNRWLNRLVKRSLYDTNSFSSAEVEAAVKNCMRTIKKKKFPTEFHALFSHYEQVVIHGGGYVPVVYGNDDSVEEEMPDTTGNQS